MSLAENGAENAHPGRLTRFVRYVGRKVKTPLALAGVATAVALFVEYKTVFPTLEDEKNKKKVLVIPFHRLELRDPTARKVYTPNSDDTIKLSLDELVEIIHEAASDPDIVALYGIFGHGSKLPAQGWSDLEEIRNALKVFREAHRVHSEPNLSHELHKIIKRTESKPLYAYADTFASLADPGNKEYYLASIFTHIHMQRNGELNLFGMLSQQLFLRDFLKKYGIVLHVFKHGEYKNFPNMFTNAGFNRAHRENVANILNGINADVCADITMARSKAILASWLKGAEKKGPDGNKDVDLLWKRIHQSGTFPATTAWKAALVDFLPRRDPLSDLIESNADDETKKAMRLKWGIQETDFLRFKAEAAVGLKKYAEIVKKKKDSIRRRRLWMERLHEHPVMTRLLAAAGYDVAVDVPPSRRSEKEKVAVLHIQGAIGDSVARKTVNTIRKIKEDKNTKVVVVRVGSPGGSLAACETISEELKGLGIPIVVSFGNTAASGGYYVSAHADRIFASNKTVTGSIGVFGVRADLSGLAKQYGISADHVSAGDLSASFAPLHPLTRKMKKNFVDSVDRYYDQFKNVVSTGRGLSEEDVEAIAQGRVWTGEQAKNNGLVDELGGLHRAIAYARRTFTESGDDADVVVWPKQSLWDAAVDLLDEDPRKLLTELYEYCSASRHQHSPVEPDFAVDVIGDLLRRTRLGLPGALSGYFLAADEDTAIRCLIEDMKYQPEQPKPIPPFPSFFWE